MPGFGETGPYSRRGLDEGAHRIYARDIGELENITSAKPGKPKGRWERMNWLDARMITLLEMADEGLHGLEERMEFRQELLALFGEVHVALCVLGQPKGPKPEASSVGG